jgi:hypothetical protein
MHAAALAEPVPTDLADEFLKKLAYVSEALAHWELSADRSQVLFRVRDHSDASVVNIAALITDVAAKMFSLQRSEPRVLHTNTSRTASFHDDPHPALEALDEIRPAGRGRYGFGPMSFGCRRRSMRWRATSHARPRRPRVSSRAS